MSDQERAISAPIFIETINQLTDIAIRQALHLYKNSSTASTKEAITIVINTLPTAIEHQVTLVLHDRWGQLMFEHILDYQAADNIELMWHLH